MPVDTAGAGGFIVSACGGSIPASFFILAEVCGGWVIVIDMLGGTCTEGFSEGFESNSDREEEAAGAPGSCFTATGD